MVFCGQLVVKSVARLVCGCVFLGPEKSALFRTIFRKVVRFGIWEGGSRFRAIVAAHTTA